jgi:uncharacterized protein with von Willebrand factor type A (vWA) domain
MRAEVAATTLVARFRRSGLPITTTQALVFVEALAVAGSVGLRPVAHATLACSPDDIRRIDEVLDGETLDRRGTVVRQRARQVDVGDGSTDGSATDGGRSATASPVEVLRDRSLVGLSQDERDQLRHLLRHSALVGDCARSRRFAPSRGRGGLDVRASIRRSLRTELELVDLRRRERRVRNRRVVLLIDVSGSMEDFARAFVLLAHASALGSDRFEAFALGTRLTRLTRVLAYRDPDEAFDASVRSAADWGGGTRLGNALRVFNDDAITNGMTRGATVVVVSDGLDAGEPALLDEQMARLARRAHRVVWVNPLRSTEGYEPRAAGMRAALAHVDEFVDGGSLEAIEHLVSRVRRPVRNRRVA